MNLDTFRLPALFSNHMVLQRDQPLSLWGWDRPGQKLQVKLDGIAVATALTGAKGSWRLTLPPLPVGKSHELVIEGTQTRVIRDVLIGEIWLCGGQSNMQFPVRQSEHGDEEAAAAEFPFMRLFTVERKTSPVPLPDVEGQWHTCSPETVREFSAVGFFFGRKLLQSLNVPIGLINVSWGGSPIEAWTALEDVEQEPTWRPLLSIAAIFWSYPQKMV